MCCFEKKAHRHSSLWIRCRACAHGGSSLRIEGSVDTHRCRSLQIGGRAGAHRGSSLQIGAVQARVGAGHCRSEQSQHAKGQFPAYRSSAGTRRCRSLQIGGRAGVRRGSSLWIGAERAHARAIPYGSEQCEHAHGAIGHCKSGL